MWLISGNDRVQKFSGDGGWQASRGSHGAANRQFRAPSGMAISATGLYIADTENQRVQQLTTVGDWQSNMDGQFSLPWGVAAAGDGSIYVADPNAERIQHFTSGGALLTRWGTHGSADGQFNSPYGAAVAGDGSIYVADTNNHRIQKFSAAGSWLASLGTHGSADGQFNTPQGLAIDGSGNVYLADTGNHRIQKFSAAGSWLTSWGSQGSADGQFNTPQGLAIDGSGNVYLADTGNHRIQKFSAGGAWLASWGNHGSADGELNQPRALAVDGGGRVYVADTGNNRIVVFHPMTYTQPIATITQLSHSSLIAGNILVATGRGQDSDETPAIIGYRWSVDGRILGLAATVTLAASLLGPGDHLLTLEVQDGEGQWSAPVSTPLFVDVPQQNAWTMLLYLAGDYPDRGHLLNQFNHMLERLRGSFHNPDLRIAVQIDGPADGDTRRLLITPGTSSNAAQFTEIAYGERAMDDPAVLNDFVQWGQLNFPARHYYLAIADHGQAIQGIAWDTTSDPDANSYLTIKEIGQALGTPGIAPIDIVQLDASSMNLLETAYELRQQTSILIASQYLAWSYFAYDDYAHCSMRQPACVTPRSASPRTTPPMPRPITFPSVSRRSTCSAPSRRYRQSTNWQPSWWRWWTIIMRTASLSTPSGIRAISSTATATIIIPTWTCTSICSIGPVAWRQKGRARRWARAATLVRELSGPQAFVITGSNRTGSGSYRHSTAATTST